MANKDKNSKKPTYKDNKEPLPPLDFTSIVLPFFTQALIKLGQINDPTINKEEENLVLAKRLIDLLELLNERTKGNLNPEEEKFFSSCLHQLRMAYLEKANIIKL